MTNDQITEMEEKAMVSLYNALITGKVTTVQGTCDILKAIHNYKKDHYPKNNDIITEVDRI